MKKSREKKGFSLLELLVALSILTIGLLGVIPLAITTIRLNNYQNQMLHARLLAERQAEVLRGLSFSDPSLADDGDTTDLDNINVPDHSFTVTEENITYTVAWNVADNVNGQGVKTIRIIVFWNDPRRPTIRRTYSVTLVRSNYEI